MAQRSDPSLRGFPQSPWGVVFIDVVRRDNDVRRNSSRERADNHVRAEVLRARSAVVHRAGENGPFHESRGVELNQCTLRKARRVL